MYVYEDLCFSEKEKADKWTKYVFASTSRRRKYLRAAIRKERFIDSFLEREM